MSRIQSGAALSVLALLLTINLGLQWIAGAYRTELGGYPDESAHFVTAVMVHDYLAENLRTSPLHFAETYYVHYPKVAIGHWPPFFYLLQAAWMFVFGVSPSSALLLVAAIPSALSFLLVRLLAPRFGSVVALLSAVILSTLPTVQEQTAMVMSDGLVALFSLAAMIEMARFIEEPEARHAGRFALFASLAVLTKGNGLALLPFALLGVMMSRRAVLFLDCRYRISLEVVALVALVWYSVTLRMALPGLVSPGWHYSSAALRILGSDLVATGGVVVIPIVAVGVVSRFVLPFFRATVQPLWSCAAALPLSVLLFHVGTPAAIDPRFLIPALAPLLMFFAAGLHSLIRALGGGTVRTAGVAALAGVLFFATAFEIRRKEPLGLGEVAGFLSERMPPRSVVLVSSQRDAEGAFIAEMVWRETRRPEAFVLRATKMLTRTDWLGLTEMALYAGHEELMADLESVPVHYLVLDHAPGSRELDHHRLLAETVARFPARWERIAIVPAREGKGVAIEVFQLSGSRPVDLPKFRIDMVDKLDRELEPRE
ncbi:MAG TPA: glycosyltransferase family 39 protein [Thermoanaerobaculia bacterium]|nr:glycosyltransferase family 39 protein [Thermoanaerobaculia bacterium]